MGISLVGGRARGGMFEKETELLSCDVAEYIEVSWVLWMIPGLSWLNNILVAGFQLKLVVSRFWTILVDRLLIWSVTSSFHLAFDRILSPSGGGTAPIFVDACIGGRECLEMSKAKLVWREAILESRLSWTGYTAVHSSGAGYSPASPVMESRSKLFNCCSLSSDIKDILQRMAFTTSASFAWTLRLVKSYTSSGPILRSESLSKDISKDGSCFDWLTAAFMLRCLIANPFS